MIPKGGPIHNSQFTIHDSAEVSKRFTSALLLVALLAFLAILLVRSVSSGLTSASIFSYPFQFDESEGMIVAETGLLDRGVDIYGPLTPDLFIAAPYPPLYYLLDWPLQHLAGPEPTFKIGRAISIAATLFVGIAIFGIAVAVMGDRLAGAIGAAAWWSLSLVTFWGSLVKPDMLAVALGLAGLWWLLARPSSQLWVALIFFLGAFYTKQTAIAGAVAGMAWLLLTRFRTGLLFGTIYAAGAVVPTLILNWLTDGGYFYHIFTLHNLPWFPARFVEFTGNLFAAYWPLFVPGVVAILVGGLLWLESRFGKRPEVLRQHAGPLLVIYLAMSAVVASASGTLGGNHNHLLDLSAAACIGLAVGVAFAVRAPSWQVRLASAVLALLLITQLPLLFSTPSWLQTEFNILSADKRDGMMNLFQYVTNNSGEAYSDNVGLLVTARKRLWSTDPFTQTHATRYGRWDESKLVAAINARQFAQIILRIDIKQPDAGAGDVSPGILQAMRDNYKLDQRNVENVYVPRQ